MNSQRLSFDHAGISVPNIEQAVNFFVDAFGFEVAITAGPYPDFGYVWVGEDGPEKGTLRQANLVLDDSFNLELLEYTNRAVAVSSQAPRPADPGGMHLAFYVENMDAKVEELARRDDVQFLGSIQREEGPPMDGLRWVYFMTEWGLVLELIHWEPGLPYEQHTSVRMALPPWLRSDT